MNAEEQRLQAAARHEAPWRKWGPYLSERQWGTVREDYSPDGAAWESFPHDHARSRAIAGVRTGSPASVIPRKPSACPWRSGTAKTRFSRSGCLA